MKEYFIEERGAYLRYQDFSGEDSIPILFIHGLGCAGSYDFPEVAAQKKIIQFRRILIDLLGAVVMQWHSFLRNSMHKVDLIHWYVTAKKMEIPCGQQPCRIGFTVRHIASQNVQLRVEQNHGEKPCINYL